MPSQAYFEIDGIGDFYDAVVATSAGQSPLTHPEKWRKVALPEFFERIVVAHAAAICFVGEGQVDKARVLRAEGVDLLDELRFQDIHEDGRVQAPLVFTR
jgi:hypothetical protein